jgi:hypothetical protein
MIYKRKNFFFILTSKYIFTFIIIINCAVKIKKLYDKRKTLKENIILILSKLFRFLEQKKKLSKKNVSKMKNFKHKRNLKNSIKVQVIIIIF